MPNERIEIAERLFESYSKNLSFYHPKLENTFLCPLCLQPFGASAIHSGELTLEHIIPSSLGGKFVTLTCKECNSKSGNRLDAHLVQRLRMEDILAGKSNRPLRVRVKVGEGEFRGDVYLSANQHPNIQIVGIPDISNPELHELAVVEFESGHKEFSISGNLGYKEIPSRVAALRVAYLLMFSYFGYGYILYRNLEQVRAQIFQPEDEMDALKGMFWIGNTPATNVIAVFEQPKELRSFLAIIDLSTNIKRNLGVVLPGPDSDSETIYQRWSVATTSGKLSYKPKIDIIYFDSTYVSSPDYKFLPARIWRKQVVIGDEHTGKE